MTKDEEIQILSDEISKAREAYYNLSPVISDFEFDAKLERLKQLRPEHVEVSNIGAPVPGASIWEKVKHEIPMGSLNKANSVEEMIEWANKTGNGKYFATHKIDGSSMELVYKAGKLVRCVTRGDGIIGEDVTVNVSKVPTVPKTLPIEIDATVRGEIVMMKHTFETMYAKEYANPRNTAAAKVREKKNKGEDCKNLDFIAYGLLKEDAPKTMFYMMIELKNLGFMVPHHGQAGDLDIIKNAFEEIKEEREEIPYEIDGVVVSMNDLDALAELGDLNMRPRGQIAWKFDAAACESRINDVVWQVGTSGRVSPVAKIEPVNIGGVTISSVSLHNLAMFKGLKLAPNHRILVSRRGDVIPFIEANLTEGIINDNVDQ
jgi:DNA ligase (NAD+)